MLARLLAKTAWWTTKKTVKYVVVPIAVAAFWATVFETATDKVRGQPDGVIDPQLKPAP